MYKKFLSLLIVFIMLISYTEIGFSEINRMNFPDVSNSPYREDIIYLKALGTLKGDGNTGMFRPNSYLSRQEFAIIVTRLSDLLELSTLKMRPGDPIPDIDITLNQALDSDNLPSPQPVLDEIVFSDKNNISDWALDRVLSASKKGLVRGYPDGSFGPRRNLTGPEAITVLLRVLGYESIIDTNDWPSAYLKMAVELGMLDDIKHIDNSPISREVMAKLTFNSLFIPPIKELDGKRAFFKPVIMSTDGDVDGDGYGDRRIFLMGEPEDSDGDGLSELIVVSKKLSLSDGKTYETYSIWKMIKNIYDDSDDVDDNKRIADLKKLADELVNVIELDLDDEDNISNIIIDIKKISEDLLISLKDTKDVEKADSGISAEKPIGEDLEKDINKRLADLKKLADELVNVFSLAEDVKLIGSDSLEELIGTNIRVTFDENGEILIIEKRDF